ncbi:hypothetical protein PCE1_004226 [Barthelona sp. PCE]
MQDMESVHPTLHANGYAYDIEEEEEEGLQFTRPRDDIKELDFFASQCSQVFDVSAPEDLFDIVFSPPGSQNMLFTLSTISNGTTPDFDIIWQVFCEYNLLMCQEYRLFLQWVPFCGKTLVLTDKQPMKRQKISLLTILNSPTMMILCLLCENSDRYTFLNTQTTLMLARSDERFKNIFPSMWGSCMHKKKRKAVVAMRSLPKKVQRVSRLQVGKRKSPIVRFESDPVEKIQLSLSPTVEPVLPPQTMGFVSAVSLRPKKPEVKPAETSGLVSLRPKKPAVKPAETSGLVSLRPKKPEVKPAETSGLVSLRPKKPAVKPAETSGLVSLRPKKPEVKPAETSGLVSLRPKKPEVKPAETSGLVSLRPKKPAVKPAETSGLVSLRPKKPEVKPAETSGLVSPKPQTSRTSSHLINEQHIMLPPTPTEPPIKKQRVQIPFTRGAINHPTITNVEEAKQLIEQTPRDTASYRPTIRRPIKLALHIISLTNSRVFADLAELILEQYPTDTFDGSAQSWVQAQCFFQVWKRKLNPDELFMTLLYKFNRERREVRRSWIHEVLQHDRSAASPVVVIILCRVASDVLIVSDGSCSICVGLCRNLQKFSYITGEKLLISQSTLANVPEDEEGDRFAAVEALFESYPNMPQREDLVTFPALSAKANSCRRVPSCSPLGSALSTHRHALGVPLLIPYSRVFSSNSSGSVPLMCFYVLHTSNHAIRLNYGTSSCVLNQFHFTDYSNPSSLSAFLTSSK